MLCKITIQSIQKFESLKKDDILRKKMIFIGDNKRRRELNILDVYKGRD